MTDHFQHNDERAGVGRWVFWGFVLIAGFFLLMEHRAHSLEYLPLLLLLACPLLHVLHGHSGHGGDHNQHKGGKKP